MPCQDDEFIRIVWGSFKAAGVAWARDFCMLQNACAMTDPETGERLFCVVSKSIERPEVPDMQKLCKRIRATADVSGGLFCCSGAVLGREYYCRPSPFCASRSSCSLAFIVAP